MKNILKIILVCLALITVSGAVEAEEKHILDTQFEQCVERDSSTYGMQSCQQKFIKNWDDELNKYYRLLGGNSNLELRHAQGAWIKFRDLEFKRIDKKYQIILQKSGGGTIWGIMIGEEKMSFIRERVLKLMADYQLLTCGMAC